MFPLPILKASSIPAFFQPFCMIGFASSDVILLQNSMIQVECNGFNVVRVNFTSMLSSLVPVSNCNLISLEYHSVNFRLKNDLADLFTMRSKGWNICVILAGTHIRRISFSFKRSKTGCVICPLKTSIISKAGWHSLSNRRRSLSTYGKIISWINLMLSVVLLKCFTLALRENGSGNLVLGILWAVFPPYINCIGRKVLEKVIPNVAVSDFLYVIPKMPTCSEPFSARVWLVTGAYFSGVWSKFIISESGIVFSSTKSTIWWKKRILASFFCAFWNVWSPCCSCPFYKTHPLKRLFVQDEFSKSRSFKCSRLLLSIKAFAVATATTLLTIPPFFRYM